MITRLGFISKNAGYTRLQLHRSASRIPQVRSSSLSLIFLNSWVMASYLSNKCVESVERTVWKKKYHTAENDDFLPDEARTFLWLLGNQWLGIDSLTVIKEFDFFSGFFCITTLMKVIYRYQKYQGALEKAAFLEVWVDLFKHYRHSEHRLRKFCFLLRNSLACETAHHFVSRRNSYRWILQWLLHYWKTGSCVVFESSEYVEHCKVIFPWLIWMKSFVELQYPFREESIWIWNHEKTFIRKYLLFKKKWEIKQKADWCLKTKYSFSKAKEIERENKKRKWRKIQKEMVSKQFFYAVMGKDMFSLFICIIVYYYF